VYKRYLVQRTNRCVRFEPETGRILQQDRAGGAELKNRQSELPQEKLEVETAVNLDSDGSRTSTSEYS
jgi:hypothetical protein